MALPDVILKCPYCSEAVRVSMDVSFDVDGGKQWTDSKVLCPNMPMPPEIFKCAKCGKYFHINEAQEEEVDSSPGAFSEHLGYEQLREAFSQKFNEPGVPVDVLFEVAVKFFIAYNDRFNREGVDISSPSEDDRSFFVDAVERFILMLEENEDFDDPVLRAEFLREIGRFDESVALLDECGCSPDEDDQVAIIREWALKGDTRAAMSDVVIE